MDEVLRMSKITKRFPGVVANDQIDFELEAGEIHALLGENGAGKTTLTNILYGMYRQDSGAIFVRGKGVNIRSPRDAIELGIGMVHQHFMLVPTMTVAENVMLGEELTTGPFLRLAEAEKRIQRTAEQYELDVSLHRPIWQLSVGEQQRVEILKILYRHAEILVLDEPTAVNTPLETEALFKVLKSIAGSGKTIVLIAHRLREVMAICDRATVLRRGRVVGTVSVKDSNETQLSSMMIGHEMAAVPRGRRETCAHGERVAGLEGVEALGNRGELALRGIDLDIFAGEILGVAGVDGNGQSELAEVLAGLRVATQGRLMLCGKNVTSSRADTRAPMGVWYVPADRTGRGTVPGLSVTLNSVLKVHGWKPYSSRGLLNVPKMQEFASLLLKTYDIRGNPGQKASTLSGGNLQKLILARETAYQPTLLIAEQPTRGLDVSATSFVRESLLRMRDDGAAILLVSADLDEILELSDRVVSLFRGRITYESSRQDLDSTQLAFAMTGL